MLKIVDNIRKLTCSKKDKLVQQEASDATERYCDLYNHSLLTAAIEGEDNRFANDLIHEALAICGSPFYKVSNRRWSDKAMKFLECFKD